MRFLFVFLVSLAFVLRIVGLSSHPSGFTPDEASFGYDAYSLLLTGKDQWGQAYPLTFKSFGDYKLPVYTYLSMLPVGIFGLTKFAVRLPNALLGSLAVIVVYFLAKELTDKSDKYWRFVAPLSMLFLTVSYWHVALSRGAFEASLTTFFMSAGTLFFLKARRNNRLLIVSMLFFGINLFTYHTARIITPLIVVLLLYLYRTSFPQNKKFSLASAVFLIFFIGAIISLLFGSGSRAATSTIFSQNLGAGNLRASVVAAGMPAFLGKVYFNEPFLKTSQFVKNYLSYFSPSFLLTEGPRESSYGMVVGSGVLSVVEFVGLPLFLWMAAKQKKAYQILLLVWLVISPLPAAISLGPGNAANRAAAMIPAVQIASAIGIVHVVAFLKSYIQKWTIGLVFFVTLILGLSGLLKYFYEQPIYAANGMIYGTEELFAFLRQYPTKHVILSRSISEAHIYAAFYDPLYPRLFQKASKNWHFSEQGLSWVDQQEGYFVGRYTIGSIDKVRDFYLDNTLVVGRPEEMNVNARILKTILTPDRKPLWVVSEKQ